MDISLTKQNMSRTHNHPHKKEEAPKRVISSFEKETSSILQKYLGQTSVEDSSNTHTPSPDIKDSLSKEEQQNIQKYAQKEKKHLVFLSV